MSIVNLGLKREEGREETSTLITEPVRRYISYYNYSERIRVGI